MQGDKSLDDVQRLAHLDFVPLVHLGDHDAPGRVARALRQSGFLLITCDALSRKLQQRSIVACQDLLHGDRSGVEKHPSDPKRYRMLRRADLVASGGETACGNISTLAPLSPEATLAEYWAAVESVKRELLTAIALGLGLEGDFFAKRHATDNDTLRLLHYPPSPGVGNRCKEHSDYGSVTLLSTDDTAGLEIWNDAVGMWAPVPSMADVSLAGDAGLLVVNAGSLLSSWTCGEVRATLHRVAGPASLRSGTAAERLETAAARHRYSLAFFVDPDADVQLNDLAGDCAAAADWPEGVSSIADYVRWRCGAAGAGVGFTAAEERRTGA